MLLLQVISATERCTISYSIHDYTKHKSHHKLHGDIVEFMAGLIVQFLPNNYQTLGKC